jgi:hypothetical protein
MGRVYLRWALVAHASAGRAPMLPHHEVEIEESSKE